MTTFVLVHGAWQGGWCWRFVAPALRRGGHEVYAPTLTGLGDRAHLARPGIDLDLHGQDVVALLEMEDLHDVVLLGHSYGGMVVTGVADRCATRIRHLVYLDAFVLENGKCALDYIVPERAASFRRDGEQSGSIAPPPLSLWGLARPEHIAFAKPREAYLGRGGGRGIFPKHALLRGYGNASRVSGVAEPRVSGGAAHGRL